MPQSSRPGRNRIIQAFVDLMQDHQMDDIPIKLLVNVAHVNRSTFYYSFPDIGAVADALVDKFVESYYEAFSVLHSDSVHGLDEGGLMRQASTDFFRPYSDYRLEFAAIRKSGRLYDLGTKLTQAALSETENYELTFYDAAGTEVTMSPDEYKLHTELVTNMTLVTVVHWADSGFELTPEELLEKLLFHLDIAASKGTMRYLG